MLVVAFPGKFLFYMSPLLLIGISVFVVRLIDLSTLTFVYVVAFGLSSVSILTDDASGMMVNFSGLWLASVTYALLFCLLAQARSFTADRSLVVSLVRWCVAFIVPQAAIGVIQFYLSGDGDYVSGSFGFFDFAFRQKTISQVNYTFTLFCMIVFILPYVHRKRWGRLAVAVWAGVAAGLIACAMAQSGHQTFFFIAALPAAMWSIKRWRGVVLAVSLGAVVFVIVVTFYPDTLWVAGEWYKKVVADDGSLKRTIVELAYYRLADLKHFFLGLGAGQYTSRASLFSAGYQSSVPLPDFLTGASGYFVADVEPLLLRYAIVGETSAIAKPYFSVVSVPAEFGVPLALLLVLLAVVEWRAMTGAQRRLDGSYAGAAVYCKFFIIFLGLDCWIENYLELMQAIAIPILLYVVARGHVRKGLRDRRAVRLAIDHRSSLTRLTDNPQTPHALSCGARPACRWR